MDLSGDIVDSFNEGLVPLTNGTGEVGSLGAGANLVAVGILEETGCARPVASSSSSSVYKVSKDFTVNLKSNLLGENEVSSTYASRLW